MILPIVIYPNQSLREKTEEVKFPLSKDVQKLTRDMIETVQKAEGIGLAAPQVNRREKLIIINLSILKLPPFPLYNPKIIRKSFRKTQIEEGCLSIPGVFGLVKRPKKVTIEAQNKDGKIITLTDHGWLARVAQHEIDHINGILIIDLIKKYTRGEHLVQKM